MLSGFSLCYEFSDKLFIISGEQGDGVKKLPRNNWKTFYTQVGDHFKCTLCETKGKPPYEGGNYSNMRTHIMRMHCGKVPPRIKTPEEIAKEKERSSELVLCSKCSKPQRKVYLNTHLQRVHDIFKCGMCKTFFPTNEDLKNHYSQTHWSQKTTKVFDKLVSPEEKRKEFEKANGYAGLDRDDKNYITEEEKEALQRMLIYFNKQNGRLNIHAFLEKNLPIFYDTTSSQRLLQLYDSQKKVDETGKRPQGNSMIIDPAYRIPITRLQMDIINDAIQEVVRENDIDTLTKEEYRNKLKEKCTNVVTERWVNNNFEFADKEEELEKLLDIIPLYDRENGYKIKLGCLAIEGQETIRPKEKVQVVLSDLHAIKNILRLLKASAGNDTATEQEIFSQYNTYGDLVEAFKEQSKQYYKERSNEEMHKILADFKANEEGKSIKSLILQDPALRVALQPIAQHYVEEKNRIDAIFSTLPHYDRETGYKMNRGLIDYISKDTYPDEEDLEIQTLVAVEGDNDLSSSSDDDQMDTTDSSDSEEVQPVKRRAIDE